MPEGDYVFLVAKGFEDTTGLPQEAVKLQNGKVLKLDVGYDMELARQ